jgi:hypothetical protein
MRLHIGEPVSRMMDHVGAACAYVIILGMLAAALAPLVMPFLHH